ncbi:hypothetical protein WJX79_007783 [Trebouxia sp. C0005]
MFPVFSARGDRRESGNASSIVSASAACTGREAVQLQVAPSLIPYISNFTEFLNNTAPLSGGIASSVMNNLTVSNCTFNNNYGTQAGAVLVNGSTDACSRGTGNSGTNFLANQAPSSKGVVYHFSQPLGVILLAITNSNFTDNIGTALVGDNSYMQINSSRFVNNSAGATGAGAIYIESLSRLLLNDCEFVNNTSLDSGGAIQTSSQDPAGIVLQGVSAYNNRAPTGGFIAAHVAAGWISCYVAILDCTFQNNAATSTQPGASFGELQGSGGAIWTNAPLLWIHNCSFVGNAAATLGGAVSYIATALPADSEHLEYEYRADAEYPSPQDSLIHSVINAAQVKNSSSFMMSATHLAGNTAQGAGGGIFATSQAGVYLLCGSSNLPETAQQLQTQLNTSSSVVPAAASQLCASWIEGQNSSPGYGPVMALPAQQVYVTCSNASGSSETYMCHSNMEVNTTAVTNFWSTNTLNTESGSAASKLLLQAGVQDGLGQVVTADWPTSSPPQLQAQGPADNPTIIYGQTNTQVDSTGMVQFQDLLLRAPKGLYNICFAAVPSLQEIKPSCVSVQVRGCQLGEVVGAMVLPNGGYWHSAANATLIHPCPNQAACQGSRAALQECAATCPGYQGRLCSICQPAYGSSGQFQCSKCSSAALSAVEYWLLLMALILCNGVAIWVYLPQEAGSWDKPQGSDYFEGLLTYTQLASILGMLNVQWPSVLQGLFKGFSWITHIAPKVVALDCLLQHHSTSSLPLSVLSTLVQLAIPFCILLFFTLLFCGLHIWSWRRNGAKADRACLNRRLKVSTYAVLGFFYTSITQAALNQFSCYQIDSPIPLNTAYPQFLQASWRAGYWVQNMQYACFIGRHLAVALGLGLPALLLLGLGIPLLFAFMVWRHRLELDSAPCRQRLGFAYRSCKSCFWHVEYMQAAAIGLLVYAALTVLLLADYQNQAAQAGLAATGIIVGVANVLMCVLYLYCMARASRGKVREYVCMGEAWVYGKFHRQLAPYASFVRTRSLASGRSLDTGLLLEMALSGVPIVSERGSAA